MQTYNAGLGRKMSTSSVHSDGSSRSTGSRLREKLENRRSILNQVDDGKIRRTSPSNQQQTDPKVSERELAIANERQSNTGTPPKIHADLERFKSLVSSKIVDAASISSTMSPCPSETGRRLKEVTSRSICRSRKKKEAAEERLRSLINAATHSFDSRTDGGASIAVTKSTSSEEGSDISLLPKMNRALFDNTAPANDENNVVCPRPRRATSQDSTRVFVDMANLTVLEKTEEWKEPITDNIQTKDNFSQQMNIHVMDNVFVFQM